MIRSRYWDAIRSVLLNTVLLKNVTEAADLIRAGKLVSFATETVYGLGANALDPLAVARVFDAKQRPHFDPLIVHLAAAEEVERFTRDVPETARLLMEKFWPGPLTLVLPKQDVIPDLVTSGLPRVAIRVPSNEQARDLIRQAGVPIAAPSANLFGCVSPTTAAHVLDGLSGRIDAVLEGGACEIGVESTVVAFDEAGRPVLLRPGGLGVEEIEAVAGPVGLLDPQQHSDDSPQAGPGMLTRHYAPSVPIEIVDDLHSLPEKTRIGLLQFGPCDRSGFRVVETLSEGGDLVEAAANFFAGLRSLESAEIDLIVATWFPSTGLGLALNDRLRRAAARD